jgi:hypothetical protein
VTVSRRGLDGRQIDDRLLDSLSTLSLLGLAVQELIKAEDHDDAAERCLANVADIVDELQRRGFPASDHALVERLQAAIKQGAERTA